MSKLTDSGSAEDLTLAIRGIEVYDGWIQSVETVADALTEGHWPMDTMTEAHVGRTVQRRLTNRPEDWTTERKMIELAPWRIAALAVLVKLGGTMTLARIREEISRYRQFTPTQRRRLVGQGGQLSWHQGVANAMTRLQHDMLAIRTGFGEYEATTKGREMIEQIKRRAGKAKD